MHIGVATLRFRRGKTVSSRVPTGIIDANIRGHSSSNLVGVEICGLSAYATLASSGSDFHGICFTRCLSQEFAVRVFSLTRGLGLSSSPVDRSSA